MDDLYWIPDKVYVKANLDDVIPQLEQHDTQIFRIHLPEKMYSILFFLLIEDEILEMLGITEEDLLLEAVLKTYDHQQYIEELIQEALQENKSNQQVKKDEQAPNTFKTQYERQYLSFNEMSISLEEDVVFKTPNMNSLIDQLQIYCENKDDFEDLKEYINQKAHAKVINRFSQIKGLVRKLVFNYIGLQTKDETFLTIIREKLKDLSIIDPLKTELLLDNFQEEQLLQVLDKQIPIVRYKILQNIKKDDKLMIEYFELICQLHPDKVIQELQKGGYPQDECLKLCRFYGNLKGLAYLLERSGSVQEAINIQFDLFISALKQKLQRQSNLINGGQELQDFIFQNLEPALNICRINSKRFDDESDNNWFLFLVRLTKLRSEFHRINQFKQVLRTFNEVQTIILEEVLEKTKIKSLLENLNQTSEKTFSQLLSGQQYELAIQAQSVMLIHQTLNDIHAAMFKDSLNGCACDIYCYYCCERIVQVSKVFQDCKHSFHVECSPEQLQCSLIDKKTINIIFNKKKYQIVGTQLNYCGTAQPVRSSPNKKIIKIIETKII
ncbi:hypothetical protein pb186bvf_006686 [Paramecium bursaria]